MYSFRISLHSRPEDVTTGPKIDLGTVRLQTLNVPIEATAYPFQVSFEQAFAKLKNLERMIVEPDGSFLWTGIDAGQSWQVEGNLFDRDDRLLYMELWGRCPVNTFDQLLIALGWPQTKLVIQLLHDGVWVDEREFRRFAGHD